MRPRVPLVFGLLERSQEKWSSAFSVRERDN